MAFASKGVSKFFIIHTPILFVTLYRTPRVTLSIVNSVDPMLPGSTRLSIGIPSGGVDLVVFDWRTKTLDFLS
jgi:hypothetical protein